VWASWEKEVEWTCICLELKVSKWNNGVIHSQRLNKPKQARIERSTHSRPSRDPNIFPDRNHAIHSSTHLMRIWQTKSQKQRTLKFRLRLLKKANNYQLKHQANIWSKDWKVTFKTAFRALPGIVPSKHTALHGPNSHNAAFEI